MLKIWQAMPVQKRVATVLSVVATIAAMYVLVSVTLKPKLDLLYAGLDPAAAGEVIAQLDAVGAVYEVRGNAIYTEIGRRDSLRLELAREGLPRQSVVGYEVFDDVNSFAMTSEMFDTAYWRAKEGELARTLLAWPTIKTARVHLGTRKSSGFSRNAGAQSASVTVSTAAGVSPKQAKAIQYLTALAVSGLEPDDVAVIDTVKGLVAGPGMEPNASEVGTGEIERAANIKRDLLSMLEARVGLGNARVNVSLDIDRQHETTAERSFDPDSRVVKSQTSSEITDTSTGSDGAVTVASNLPEGAAGGGDRTADRNESSETVTYEISELVKNTEKLPGAITRMTVAVLVNDAISFGDDGEVIREPRTEQELQALQDLVSMAAGLNTERGDQLTVKNLSFDVPVAADAVAKPSLLDTFLQRYLWAMVQSVILAVVVLILGLFVVRPLLRPQSGEQELGLLPMSLDTEGNSMGLPAGGPAGHLAAPEPTDPIEVLKAMASEKPEDAADILSKWLGQEEQVAN